MSDATKRRQAREIAMQVLFQKEFVKDFSVDFNAATALAYFRETIEAPPESWLYAEKLITGIEDNQVKIDTQITEKSRNWKVARMAPVDLCLLRIGAFEILFMPNEVPPKVAINEAIEIAKRFGGSESPQFVNGILDEILKGKN